MRDVSLIHQLADLFLVIKKVEHVGVAPCDGFCAYIVHFGVG